MQRKGKPFGTIGCGGGALFSFQIAGEALLSYQRRAALT